MKWNKKYDYPTSSRATVDGIRRYLLGETKLPSVTSVIDMTRSDEEKAALLQFMGQAYGHTHKQDQMIVGQSQQLSPQSHIIKQQCLALTFCSLLKQFNLERL